MSDLFEAEEAAVEAERVDLRTAFLRERYDLPAEWRWSSFEAIGQFDPSRGYSAALYKGGVFKTLFQRGPRKGQLNFGKAEPGTEATVVLMDSDFDAWLPTWEASTGKCHKCTGSGQQWIGWNCETGNRYRPCPRCGASGHAPAEQGVAA